MALVEDSLSKLPFLECSDPDLLFHFVREWPLPHLFISQSSVLSSITSTLLLKRYFLAGTSVGNLRVPSWMHSLHKKSVSLSFSRSLDIFFFFFLNTHTHSKNDFSLYYRISRSGDYNGICKHIHTCARRHRCLRQDGNYTVCSPWIPCSLCVHKHFVSSNSHHFGPRGPADHFQSFKKGQGWELKTFFLCQSDNYFFKNIYNSQSLFFPCGDEINLLRKLQTNRQFNIQERT